jgi:hypothetical protein
VNVEQLIVALASAAAVAALVLVARGLGFRADPKLATEEAARALFAEAEPDARVAQVLVAKDGRAALAHLEDGRIAVARAMGDRFAVRAFPKGAVAVAADQGGLRVTFADLGFPALKMSLDAAAPDWLA